MKPFPLMLFAFALLLTPTSAQNRHPGAELFTPTRIDYLATVLQASLRRDAVSEDDFDLGITYTDSETILIYVRYHPNADRKIINMTIESAHRVIKTTAHGYGWDGWVKIKEDVDVYKPSDLKP